LMGEIVTVWVANSPSIWIEGNIAIGFAF
jgi:hypothetical protein